MIDQYGAAAKAAGLDGRTITLRINPGFGHGHSQKTNTGGSQSKHGIWHAQLADCAARAAKHGLMIAGLHMHIGSGSDMEHLGQVCGAMEKAALEIGPSITSISAGGGLPIDYREGQELADTGAYLQTLERLPRTTRHRLRPPGRARNRARPLPRRRERLSHHRDPRREGHGREQVLLSRRRL